MDAPYIGAIFIWAGNFAPKDYAFCNGQLLPISQYQALFSILGTTYGGDGQTTFSLPNLCGRMPLGAAVQGGGANPNPQTLGASGGNSSLTLTTNNLPAHNHPATFTPGAAADIAIPAVAGSNATTNTPGTTTVLSKGGSADRSPVPMNVYSTATADTTLKPFSVNIPAGNVTVGSTGSNAPINTVPPFQALNFIIALNGLYPPRD